MKDELWEAIHDVFSKTESLCETLNSSEKTSQTESSGIDAEMIRIRADIRTHLEFLREKLTELLTERESYLILFPIVIYFDELIQNKYLPMGVTWPTLQRELYQIDEGGDLFYDSLDDVISKPQTHPFIYEVYYFCIHHGFKGRHNNDPVKINAYKKKLIEKIPVKKIEGDLSGEGAHIQIKNFFSPIWYYIGAAALFGGCYFLLRLYTSYYVKPF